ncbi:MAG: hypothetical protein KF764_27450 [Labilithrix sp.]|nr:hypothetical protein [Labilithrix sp.]MBX3221413.1 hypothetical protein [Labilithrix sp.]
MPGVVAAVAVMTTLLAEGVAFAAPDDREQCAASAEQAQALRDEGKYRRAREQMLVCARDVCPGPIKSDCGKWLTELDRDAPTVVFGARDNKGSDVLDVKVSMDGALIQERLDGKPVLVDSGEHTFKFESNDGAVKEERVLVRAAEKARPLIATFPGPAVADTDKDKDKDKGPGTTPAVEGGSIVPAIVVGGIGVVALGSFAIFGIGGKNAVDDLQGCKPRCPEEQVDSARTKLIIADISLGVGIVALGVAAYMFLTRPAVDTTKVPTAVQATNKKKDNWLRLDGGPVNGGGYAGVGGTF